MRTVACTIVQRSNLVGRPTATTATNRCKHSQGEDQALAKKDTFYT